MNSITLNINRYIYLLDIKIDYSFILSDHHPLVFIINQNTIPRSISYICIIHTKSQWNRLDKKHILKYNIDTKFNLGKLINDIYSFDSNINYSDYLYNSLLSIN